MKVQKDSIIEEFLDYLHRVRGYSRHTIRAYSRELEQWQNYLAQQGGSICSAKRALARSYVAALLRGKTPNKPGKQNQENLSNRSINRRISALKSFYRYLQKRDKLAAQIDEAGDKTGNEAIGENAALHSAGNPWEGIAALPQRKRLPGYLGQNELQRLAEACQTAFPDAYRQKLSRALLELGFSSGGRVSELCALSLRQLCPQTNNAEKHWPQNAPNADDIAAKICIFGKGGKQRFIFLGPQSRKALAAYIAERRNFLEQLQQKNGPKNAQAIEHAALFCNRRGTRLQPRSARALLSQLGRTARLEKPLHPHLLRHSFATALLNEGVGIRSVQELLGHSSLGSTQIYTHVGIQRLREAHRRAHPHGCKNKA